MTFLQNRIEINCFLTDHHRLIAALHGFTARLYGRLHGQSGNIAVSPFSVASALAMLVAGTSGSTRQGLKTTIGYEDDDATLHAGMSSLITLLKAPADGEATHALETANALWLQAGWIPGKPFAALVENHYETSLRAVDFQNDAGSAVDFINSWADTHTRGRISSLISSLLPSTRLVVANTVWLKCGWEKKFESGRTKSGTFHAPSGDIIVPLMHQTTHSRCLRIEDGVMALLDCSGGDSLVVVVPDTPGQLRSLEAQVSAGALPKWIADTDRVKVDWILPKLTLKPKQIDLTRSLCDLGLASGGSGDFSTMATPPIGDDQGISLDAVLHSAFLAVDEQGIEAAAATIISRIIGMPVEQDPIPVHCDRPFIWAIRHGPTRTILFIGRVEDPTLSS